MAVVMRGQGTEVQNHHKRWKERAESSPERERTRVWTEPAKLKPRVDKRVAVVYYLARNGQLEHPHFMEVPLSSSDGLFLKDVINRLNALRGKGMATMYSWSSKRSYKNGFVWHDLSEDDFIHPAHGREYVLKGSELLNSDPACYDPKVLESSSSRSLKPPPELQSRDFPEISRRRNQSWSSIDLHEYKVYKADSVGDPAGKYSASSAAAAADASTQTDDRRSRRKPAKLAKEDPTASTELSRDEISPPPSDSSPETLESLMKADPRLVICSGEGGSSDGTVEACPIGSRAGRASTVLMQLLSCGSVSFKNCGPSLVKDHGLSLIGSYGSKGRLTRGGGGAKLEEKEYFSGSLVETKKDEGFAPSLQRSTSCNADRSSRLEISEEELGVRTKCIPRKPKGLPAKKESNIFTTCDTIQGAT